ncbi:head-tail connector protein [Sphingomonas sp. 1P06PA]|uniref:head-tail connector protein n=1 Tax=Sphingomonas sp. 1P06PA TaxID=554121 RepID=UPI0039A766AA
MITLITPPTDTPISVEEAREQCRIDGTGEDAFLEQAINAATHWIETYTGQRLVTQTVSFTTDTTEQLWRLPVSPIQNVTGIEYIDTAGTTGTVDPDSYVVRKTGMYPSIVLASNATWPNRQYGSQITVTAVVGFGDPADVPDDIRLAVKILVSAIYDNRGAIPDDAGRTLDWLLERHRRIAV